MNIKYFKKSLLIIFITAVALLGFINCSEEVQEDIPPVASNVEIKGTPMMTETLTGEYTYKDEDEDPEGDSIYKWWVGDSENGRYEEIPGATTTKYTVSEEDGGRYIKFEVTPVSTKETGDVEGKAVQSDPVLIDDMLTINIKTQQELDEALEKYKDNDKIRFKLGENEYNIHEVFNGNDSFFIEGTNKEGVKLKGNLRFNECNNIKVDELTLDHQTNSGNEYGLAFEKTKGSKVENVVINDAVTNGVEITESEVDVDGAEFNGSGASNILYKDGSTGKVSNVISNDAKTLDGVSIKGSKVDIENSTFEGNNQSGIYYYDGAEGTVKGCTSVGNKELHGIEVKKSKVNIEGGTYSENGQNGILYKESTGTITGITAENNKTRQGIQIQQKSQVDINDSFSNGNGQSGLYIFDQCVVNIIDFIAKNNSINGIKVENSEVNIKDSTFESNKESGVNYRKQATGNINNITSISSKEYYGFEFNEAGEMLIKDSNFEKNAKAGISINKTKNLTFDNVIASNNEKDGFMILSSEVTIKNSNASNNKRYGIITEKSIINIQNLVRENNESDALLNIGESSTINVLSN